MFMRLFRARIKPENTAELKKFYEEKAIPALQKTDGCLYACLIQSVQHQDEYISMTLWETQVHAEQYVKRGAFQSLFEEARHFFADSSEWKIQLTSDWKLDYQPVPEEPIVESYQIAAKPTAAGPPAEKIPLMYLRIFSAKLLPEKKEEFKRIYTSEIIPALLSTPGCRYAYLTESIKESSEMFSITIWDRKEDADAFEASNRYSALLKKVKHTFSDLIQWKMGLSSEQRGQTVTSDDLAVKGYTFVAGKSFR